jgi:teichuronic acid biosynthesis glycosyltransferase TuaG
MESSNPKVSIITPLYNAGRFLLPCIESVLGQTYTNWEMILVDDCSTDDSLKVARRYAMMEKRVNVDQLPNNQGSGPARNRATEIASGDLIAFLDSDDIWHRDKLKIHVAEMVSKNASFSHTSYGYINEDGNVIRQTFHVSNKPVTYTDLLKRTEISCLTAMYDVRKVGKMYMPDLRRKQDYALWLAILKKGFPSYPVDQELAWYRQRKNSATNNKFKLIKGHWSFLREHEKLNLMETNYYFFCWIYNGLIKYYL